MELLTRKGGLVPSLLHGYPEILVALACFFLLRILHHGRSPGPLNWPVLGMLPGLLLHVHRLHDWATDLLRTTGCTFMFKGPWFSGMDFLATCDPAVVNHVFNANFFNYPKGDDFLESFDILGDGIFNADSESWKRQRRMAHTLFSDRKFRHFVAETSRTKVEKGIVPFLEHAAKADEVFDLQDIFLRFTFDNTCSLVFGVDPGALSAGLPTVPFAKAMDDAEEAILHRHVMPASWWKLFRCLGIGHEKKLALAWETIDQFITENISRRVEETNRFREAGMELRSGYDNSSDLLTSYLDQEGIKYPESHKILRDTTLNFMLAGRDTTGSALTWFFWLLSKNPRVENKILEELKGRKSHARDLTSEDGLTRFDSQKLSNLVYLHAALCESLRLFPPVPFEHKAVLKPDVLPNGHKVDQETKIYVFLYSMGRMKEIWGEDCSEFKPERWISGHGTLKHEPSYKFLSFNAGPRTCLGKDVAFTQMKEVAAAVIYNFSVQVVEGHVVTPKISVILHMKNGLRVRVKKRRVV